MDGRSAKLVLTGAAGVGKTALITRLATGAFEPGYAPTLNTARHPLEMRTSEGLVSFDVWDCSCMGQHAMLSPIFWREASGAVIMFSHTSAESYLIAGRLVRKLRGVCSMIPIVVCGSHADAPRADRQVSPENISADSVEEGFLFAALTVYVDVSAASNLNCEEPFLKLARVLFSGKHWRSSFNPSDRPALSMGPPALRSAERPWRVCPRQTHPAQPVCTPDPPEHRLTLVLIGDSNVGKTALVDSLRSGGGFTGAYEPTQGVNASTLSFHTCKGLVTFDVWDCAGMQALDLPSMLNYLAAADCAIVMFSHTSIASYRAAMLLKRQIHGEHPSMPIVVCGGKTDAPAVDRQVSHTAIATDFAHGSPCAAYFDVSAASRHNLAHGSPCAAYFDVSAASRHNLEKPFLAHARRILGAGFAAA